MTKPIYHTRNVHRWKRLGKTSTFHQFTNPRRDKSVYFGHGILIYYLCNTSYLLYATLNILLYATLSILLYVTLNILHHATLYIYLLLNLYCEIFGTSSYGEINISIGSNLRQIQYFKRQSNVFIHMRSHAPWREMEDDINNGIDANPSPFALR